MTYKPTILIADDNMGFVKALSVRLEESGYDVITATDGYNALARAVEERPDVLVLDVHMPAGSGFTVQERLTKMPELAGVPVIYVTGDKSEQAREAATIAGAFGLLHKPVDIEELQELIARGLGARAA